MKKILLAFFLSCLVVSLPAQTLPEHYAQYGELILVKLDSAPFPHPDRAQGHTYQKQLYTAEKNYSDNSVAIFVPKGFRPTAKVDLVVHFHGWRHHIENTLAEYQLIEQFVESGRNAILIVPQGPYDAPDSFGGKLEDAGGFQRFMGDVMDTLRQQGVITNSVLGSIILSGHSGGYQVISSIVARGGLSEQVKEVWLFDALYARREQFSDWFLHYPGRRLIDIYTPHGGTKEESEGFMTWLKAQQPPVPFLSKNEPEVSASDLRDNHLIFMYSELEHNDVVFKRHQFCEYLKTSRLGPIKVYSSPKAAGE
ncbi:MAG: hypothetical protein JWQ04_3202 [Pedosphaera sp.]|nr:hypothetical protein [Pedosphaera sp.]